MNPLSELVDLIFHPVSALREYAVLACILGAVWAVIWTVRLLRKV
jgi:hypothetical protein